MQRSLALMEIWYSLCRWTALKEYLLSRVTLQSETPLGCFSLALKGRVIDGLGRPIDGRKEIEYDDQVSLELGGSNALARENITEVLDTGIKAIDSCFTFGKGQRMG